MMLKLPSVQLILKCVEQEEDSIQYICKLLDDERVVCLRSALQNKHIRPFLNLIDDGSC